MVQVSASLSALAIYVHHVNFTSGLHIAFGILAINLFDFLLHEVQNFILVLKFNALVASEY